MEPVDRAPQYRLQFASFFEAPLRYVCLPRGRDRRKIITPEQLVIHAFPQVPSRQRTCIAEHIPCVEEFRAVDRLGTWLFAPTRQTVEVILYRRIRLNHHTQRGGMR